MKNFLKKHGYLIYFGISTIIFSRYGIFSIRFWIALVILLLLVEMAKGFCFWSNTVFDDIGFIKKYIKKLGWVLGLGFLSTFFVPLLTIRWWIISIPTFCLILYKLIIVERN